MKSRLTIMVAMVAVLAAACGGDTAEETDTTVETTDVLPIKVALIPIVDYAQFYLGLQEGIFEKHGLDVEVTEIFSSPGLVSSVTSAATDIATTSYTQLVTGVSNAMPIKAVAGGSLSPTEGNTEILVLEESPIQDFGDLEGKVVQTVAVHGLFHLGTLAAVEATGGDWSTVEALPGAQPELADALAAGRVDAIVIQEPFLSQFMRDHGFRSLGNPYGSMGYPVPAGVWISSSEQVEAKPELMRRFRAAMIEAGDFAQANPDAVKAIIPEFTTLTAEQVADLSLPTFSGVIPDDSIMAMGEQMLRYGWLSYIPSLSQLVWTDPDA